jgi:hypothetical protein
MSERIDPLEFRPERRQVGPAGRTDRKLWHLDVFGQGMTHSCLHGHQIPRQTLRHFRPNSGRRAAEARKEADKLACDAWNKRMLAFKGPAQPSPTLGDAPNAGYTCLERRYPTRRTQVASVPKRL